MEDNKEKFYVFLDFDGVMYDIKDAIKRKREKSGKLLAFSKDSVEALNTLMSRLSQDYSPELVVSSLWRHSMPFALKVLKNQGVDFNNFTVSHTDTKGNPLKRGLNVKNYLEGKPNSENYLIIDDTPYDFAEYFPEERMIKTNILNDRLTPDKVEEFFKRFGFDKEDFTA